MTSKTNGPVPLISSRMFMLAMMSSESPQMSHHTHPLRLEEHTDKDAHVRDLIRNQSWTKLEKVLDDWIDNKNTKATTHSDGLVLSIGGGFVGETSKENALHQACRKSAPIVVIQKLCTVCTDLAGELDSEKRTPLHVAVEKKIDCEYVAAVVDFLLTQNDKAVFVQDENKRTPLHLACKGGDSLQSLAISAEEQNSLSKLLSTIAEIFSHFSMGGASSAVERVLRTLCKSNPGAVNEEDAMGMTPIEYAIESDIDFSILSKMWALSENQWKIQ